MEWFFVPRTLTCGESADFVSASGPFATRQWMRAGKPLKNPHAERQGLAPAFDKAAQPRGKAQDNPLKFWLVKEPARQTYERIDIDLHALQEVAVARRRVAGYAAPRS
eukprot:SAG31_NODE_1288_length_8994_cov_4.105003_7_plen_108_part_00